MKHFIFSTSGLFDIFICKRSCDGFYSDFDCSNKSPKLLIVARYQNIYIYFTTNQNKNFKVILIIFACLGVIKFLLTQPYFDYKHL